MPRSFRFSAPTARPAAVLRRRLLATLHQRWDHRVTLVLGGAGLGKTTLLAQAIAENRIEPRGRDAWLGLDAEDAAGALAADVLHALGEPRRFGPVSAVDVADAMWARSPQDVCLVFDDVHVLPRGSPGNDFLADLVGALPGNGHVVLASRVDPAIPIARFVVAGGVLRITESQLRYDDTELADLAASRGIDPATLAETGGWPAMSELVASARPGLADEYLWQEVIDPLERTGRRILSALVDLGGADDALISAALDTPVTLGNALAAVPLIDVDDSGWFRPHDLWRPMARLRLADAERGDVLRRAVGHLIDNQRYDDAMGLIARTQLWSEAPAVLRDACIELTRHPPAEQLARWLRACPSAVRDTGPAALADAVRVALVDPDNAVEPLQRAAGAFRAAGDVDAELAAISQLSRVAWWARDWEVLVANGKRIVMLSKQGHDVATGLAAIGRALSAEMKGDDDTLATALDEPALATVGAEWHVVIAWIRAAAAYVRGDLATAMAASGPALDESRGTTFHEVIAAMHSVAEWYSGRGDRPLAVVDHRHHATTARHNATLRFADVSRTHSFAGDVDHARVLLDEARADTTDKRPLAAVRVALAEASLYVADGDERRAARVLQDTIARFDLDTGNMRRAWRDGLCLTYVLLPEARPVWDASPITGTWANSRRLAAAVVASRDGRFDETISRVDVADAQVVCRVLHYRFAAELAVGLAGVGRPEGIELLDRLGGAGRAVVRQIAERGDAAGRAARGLLAAVPAAPPVTVEIGVLGRVQVSRDGEPVDAPELRRERVRALLAYLTLRRRASRGELLGALWPDLDERSGANNLRVTLNHLLQVLEPWRSEREPSYLIRSDSSGLRLVSDPHLDVDLDRFNAKVDEARRAERDGIPSQALESFLGAVELWRGDLFRDLIDQAWLELEREQVRARYVEALVRAAQLLAGRGGDGDIEHAEALARRAIVVDPWSEPAYGVLIAAGLGRGDRSSAHWLLQRALSVADELGVDPSAEIVRLARRIEAG